MKRGLVPCGRVFQEGKNAGTFKDEGLLYFGEPKAWGGRVRQESTTILVCQESEQGKVAYASFFYGMDDEAVAQAIHVGYSLRTRSPGIDVVLLLVRQESCCATNSSKEIKEQREALAAAWSIIEVDDMVVHESWLLNAKDKKWTGVYNRVHAFGLTQYDKVLLLDIDLHIRGDPRGVFELPLEKNECYGLVNGCEFLLNAGDTVTRDFFVQGHGDLQRQFNSPNCGVILLKPDKEIQVNIMDTLSDPREEGRVARLRFLEQEFFALYFRWRMLCVDYNFKVGSTVRCHSNNDPADASEVASRTKPASRLCTLQVSINHRIWLGSASMLRGMGTISIFCVVFTKSMPQRFPLCVMTP